MTRRHLVMTLCFLLLLTGANRVQAQNVPSVTYLSAAAVDWTTTARCFHASPFCGEGNPMYGWVRPNTAWTTIPQSMAFDVFTVYAVNRWIKPSHPKLAKVGLFVGAGVRIYAAASNVRFANNLSRCRNVVIPNAC